MKLNPISEIKANLGIQPNGPVQAFFTDTCKKHMDKYVPLGATGLLRQNVRTTVNIITYESSYAHYQYIGKLYVMDNGKGAYYDPDYGFWSKPRSCKNTDRKKFKLSYTTAQENIGIKECGVQKEKK